MASALAFSNGNQGETEQKTVHTIPPIIRDLLGDLAEIRRVTLTESPQILPLIAPSLIEAEVHIRQLWASQM